MQFVIKPKKSEKVQLATRVDETLAEKFEAACQEADVSVAECLRQFVEQYVENKEAERARKRARK